MLSILLAKVRPHVGGDTVGTVGTHQKGSGVSVAPALVRSTAPTSSNA